MVVEDRANWECLRAAGITQDAMHQRNISPVRLEETVRYHRELRAGDEVEVTCAFLWGDGKTFRVHHEVRVIDGDLAAEVINVGGVLDLGTRRLLPDPGSHFRSLASAPHLLGLRPRRGHSAKPRRSGRPQPDSSSRSSTPTASGSSNLTIRGDGSSNS